MVAKVVLRSVSSSRAARLQWEEKLVGNKTKKKRHFFALSLSRSLVEPNGRKPGKTISRRTQW